MKFLSARLTLILPLILAGASSIANPPTYYESDPLLQEEARELVKEDIAALESLQFPETSKAHKEYFGVNGGKALAEFITKRTEKFQFAILPPSTLARASKGVMTLDQRYPRLTQLKRWWLLIHESRHNESKSWPHVYCPTPYSFTLENRTYNLQERAASIAGTPGCDNRADGAYGVSYAFLMSIAEACTNCDQDMREEAFHIAKTEGFIRITDPAEALRLVQSASLYPEKAVETAHDICRSHARPQRLRQK